MLTKLTFTGVESNTVFPEIERIAKKYPKTEFGILIGSDTYSWIGNGIFPSLAFIHDFRRFMTGRGLKGQTALHLCGKYSRQIMNIDQPLRGLFTATFRDPLTENGITKLCQGFGRVQINLHGDTWDPKDIAVRKSSLVAFADKLEEGCGTPVKIIIQHRLSSWDVPVKDNRIQYLWDRSGGRGIFSIRNWPFPNGSQEIYGYAGGIGLDTIKEALAYVNWHKEPMWLDMESKIRTDGKFDLGIVEQICKRAFNY